MTIEDMHAPSDAHQWEAQEQGLRAARGGDDPSGREAADYRLVAKAVATAPRSQPPADFAAVVASRAGTTRKPGLEPALVRGLMLILAIASILVTVPAAGPAWRAIRDGLAAGGLSWVAAGAACMVASWVMSQVRQIRAIPPGAGQN
ncbi:MAG: hypothetical protein ACTHZI_00380 [Luteimonas sp.]